MYEKILVPLDGSAFAEQIIPHARGIAQADGARLVLLRVARDASSLSTAREYLDRLAGRLEAESRVVEAGSRHVGEAIDHEQAGDQRTLIAMTTHGRTGLTETIMGSVARDLMCVDGQPVLLFRPLDVRHGGLSDQVVVPSTVIAAVDGSEPSEIALRHAADFAIAIGARLTLVQAIPVHTGTPDRIAGTDMLESSYVQRQANGLATTHPGLLTDWEVLHGGPAEAICDYARQFPDPLLVLGARVRPGWERTLLGSVSAECVRRASVPILVSRSSHR